jgi:hypothetical protein
MNDSETDLPEFTDEELLAALRRVGDTARATAFAAGRPIIVIKGSAIMALHADGTEEVIEMLQPLCAVPSEGA